jgi:TonB family protein
MRAFVIMVLLASGLVSTSAQDAEKPPIAGARKFATFSPRPIVPPEARAKHLKGAGVCIVYLRPDGTVSRAEMSLSTGEPLLDKASIEAFSRWKFVPGTVKKVKIPIRYTGNYTKPPHT